jgi:hypothetical protein
MMLAELRLASRQARLATLVLLISLAAVLPGYAQEQAATWYAERITSGDTPVHVEHLWSRGPKLRAETVIGGRPIVTIVNGERYIMIDRVANTGVSIQRSPKAMAADAKRDRPFGNEWKVLEAAGGELVSTERIAGRTCDLYRLTNADGRREICVSQDEARLPLLLKVWSRASSREARTNYLDWTSHLAINDTFFEPDPSTSLEQLSYEDYVRRASDEQIGPAPPFFRELLHGTK